MGRGRLSIPGGSCRLGIRRPSCGTGLQTLLLDANGHLDPCLNTNIPQFRFGNIRDAGFGFADAWRHSPVLAMVRTQTSIERTENPCSRCLVKYWFWAVAEARHSRHGVDWIGLRPGVPICGRP